MATLYRAFLLALYEEADSRKRGAVTASDIDNAVQRRQLLSGTRGTPTSTGGRARGSTMRKTSPLSGRTSRGFLSRGGGVGAADYGVDVFISLAALLGDNKTLSASDFVAQLSDPETLGRSDVASFVAWILAQFVKTLEAKRFLTPEEAHVAAKKAMRIDEPARRQKLKAKSAASTTAAAAAAATAETKADADPSTPAFADSATDAATLAAADVAIEAIAADAAAAPATPPSAARFTLADDGDEWGEVGPQARELMEQRAALGTTSARRGTYFGSFPGSAQASPRASRGRSQPPSQTPSPAPRSARRGRSATPRKVITVRAARGALEEAEEAAGLTRSSRVPGVPRNRPTTRNLWLRHFDLALLEFKEAGSAEERSRALATIKELKAMGIPSDAASGASGAPGGGREKTPAAASPGKLTSLYGLNDLDDLRSLRCVFISFVCSPFLLFAHLRFAIAPACTILRSAAAGGGRAAVATAAAAAGRRPVEAPRCSTFRSGARTAASHRAATRGESSRRALASPPRACRSPPPCSAARSRRRDVATGRRSGGGKAPPPGCPREVACRRRRADGAPALAPAPTAQRR
jgi:hypothetical protein